jgi:hypothetical protein
VITPPPIPQLPSTPSYCEVAKSPLHGLKTKAKWPVIDAIATTEAPVATETTHQQPAAGVVPAQGPSAILAEVCQFLLVTFILTNHLLGSCRRCVAQAPASSGAAHMDQQQQPPCPKVEAQGW